MRGLGRTPEERAPDPTWAKLPAVHYVVASDGQKYGPADIPTLNTWIAAGRLYPTSTLEEEGTGRRLPASALPDLVFAAPTFQPPPTPSPYASTAAYPRAGYLPPSAPFVKNENDHGKLLGAFALGVAAIVVAVFVGFFSIALSIYGIRLAWAAKEDGHPAGWVAVVFNVLVIVAVLVIRFGLRSHRVV